MKALFRRLGGAVSIQPGEGAPTFLAFSYSFLIIGSYLALKAARDSIFLNEIGPQKLPFVILGIALVTGVFVGFYIRLAKHVATTRLVAATQLFFASNLVLFWWTARADAPWLPWVLYIWVGCFGIIAPVQFWTLANEVFSTRQAKRLFNFIGAGGIMGGFVGGQVVGLIAKAVGTVNLMLIVAAQLLVCVLIAALLSRYRISDDAAASEGSGEESSPATLGKAAKLIANSGHLSVIAGLVWVSAFGTTVADWQFKATAFSVHQDDVLTSFLGFVYSYVSLASLLVQIVLVRFVFRRFGLGLAILILPFSLILGSLTFVTMGSLWAAILMRFSDGSFKHSVDRSSKELAYLPVSPGIKTQVKSAIDMVLDRVGDGSGALLVLLLITILPADPNQVLLNARIVGAVNIAVLGLWLYLALRLRKSYMDQLAYSIGSGEAPSDVPDASLEDQDARRALLRALRSQKPGEVMAALDIAAMAPSEEYTEELRRLTREGDPEVRAKALGLLLEPGASDLPEGMTTQLEADDQDLLVKALDVVLAESDEEVREKAQALMGDGNPETRGALLALLVRRLGDEFFPVAEKIVTVLASPGSPTGLRESAAFALGLIPNGSPLTGRLADLMRDADNDVRSRAAESAGRLASEELAPALVELLGQAGTRGAARRALVSMKGAAAPALLAALASPATDDGLRQRIPRLLSEIDEPAAHEALAMGLKADDQALRDASLAALLRVRRLDPGRALIDPQKIRPRVLEEIEHLEGLQRLMDALRTVKGKDGAFLLQALEESTGRSRHRVFDLLELCHSPAELRRIRKNVAASSKILRDNAIELLDSMLPREVKTRLLPLVERMHDGEVPPADAEAVSSKALQGALAELAKDSDPWLAACALNVGARQQWPGATEAALSRVGAGDELLATEATRVLDRLREGEEADAVTLVDKVIALRGIDAFSAVPTHQLSFLARVAREGRFRPGEVLFMEGDPPGPLYLLLDGRVGLRQGSDPAGTLESGRALGAWSLFDDRPRALGAVALESTQALVIDRDDFYDVLAEQPGIVRSLMADLTRRLGVSLV